MVLGRRTPWLPKKLCNKGFKHASFNKARDKIRPVTRKVDVLIKPRLTVFVTPAAARVVGVICILMALTMPPLEIIPMAGYIPAVTIARSEERRVGRGYNRRYSPQEEYQE